MRAATRLVVLAVTTALPLALLVPVGVSAPAMATSRPDLVVARVVETPGARAAGESFTLTDTVKNLGRSKAGKSRTAYFLSLNTRADRRDVRLGGRAVPALAPGKSSIADVTVSIPGATRDGLYYVIACADARHVVRETREGNNCRSDPAATSRVLVAPPLPAPNPQTVDPKTETAQTRTVTIDAANGGTVRTVGADGTTYALQIPAGGLEQTTDISITPVTSIDNLGMRGGMSVAVALAPDGLQLLRPGTLTITPASPQVLQPADGLHLNGFSYQTSGQDFHLYPAQGSLPGGVPDSARLQFSVMHFSGYGAGLASASDEASIEGRLTAQRELTLESSIAKVADQVSSGEIPEDQFGPMVGNALVESFARDLVPAINKALSPSGSWEDSVAATNAFLRWDRWMQVLGLSGGHNTKYNIDYDAIETASWNMVFEIVKLSFQRSFESCLADKTPVEMYQRMWSLVRRAAVLSRDGRPEGMLGADYQAKLDECAKRLPTTWAGTITYSIKHTSTPQSCSCAAMNSETTLTTNVKFVAPPGSQNFRAADGSYSVTYHSFFETQQSTPRGICDYKSDVTESASGSTSAAEQNWLRNFDLEPYAYFGFSVTPSIRRHVVATYQNCEGSTNEDYWTEPFPTPFGTGNCPGFPRPDGENINGLRAVKTTTTNGRPTLDFSCSDRQVNGGDTTDYQVTGTLVRDP